MSIIYILYIYIEYIYMFMYLFINNLPDDWEIVKL